MKDFTKPDLSHLSQAGKLLHRAIVITGQSFFPIVAYTSVLATRGGGDLMVAFSGMVFATGKSSKGLRLVMG